VATLESRDLRLPVAPLRNEVIFLDRSRLVSECYVAYVRVYGELRLQFRFDLVHVVLDVLRLDVADLDVEHPPLRSSDHPVYQHSVLRESQLPPDPPSGLHYAFTVR
jgi:hypothetical protein